MSFWFLIRQKDISTKVVVTFYLKLRNELQPLPAKNQASNWLTSLVSQSEASLLPGFFFENVCGYIYSNKLDFSNFNSLSTEKRKQQSVKPTLFFFSGTAQLRIEVAKVFFFAILKWQIWNNLLVKNVTKDSWKIA